MALAESAAWPLTGLRQSFLSGALTRLLDPDSVLKAKIVEFVGRGEFGLASGPHADDTYDRVWFDEMLPPEEVSFDAGVFLLRRARAQQLKEAELKGGIAVVAPPETRPDPGPGPAVDPGGETGLFGGSGTTPTAAGTRTMRLTGQVPPEVWNRIGTRLIPKLRGGTELKLGLDLVVTVEAAYAAQFEADLHQALEDLDLAAAVRIEAANGA